MAEHDEAFDKWWAQWTEQADALHLRTNTMVTVAVRSAWTAGVEQRFPKPSVAGSSPAVCTGSDSAEDRAEPPPEYELIGQARPGVDGDEYVYRPRAMLARGHLPRTKALDACWAHRDAVLAPVQARLREVEAERDATRRELEDRTTYFTDLVTQGSRKYARVRARAEDAEAARAAAAADLNGLQAGLSAACGVDGDGQPRAGGWSDDEALRFLAAGVDQALRLHAADPYLDALRDAAEALRDAGLYPEDLEPETAGDVVGGVRKALGAAAERAERQAVSEKTRAMLDEALGFDWLWEGVPVSDGHVRTHEEVLERMGKQAACLKVANATAKRRGEQRDEAEVRAEQAERRCQHVLDRWGDTLNLQRGMAIAELQHRTREAIDDAPAPALPEGAHWDDDIEDVDGPWLVLDDGTRIRRSRADADLAFYELAGSLMAIRLDTAKGVLAVLARAEGSDHAEPIKHDGSRHAHVLPEEVGRG